MRNVQITRKFTVEGVIIAFGVFVVVGMVGPLGALAVLGVLVAMGNLRVSLSDEAARVLRTGGLSLLEKQETGR